MPPQSQNAVGIDLGFATSCVGVWRDPQFQSLGDGVCASSTSFCPSSQVELVNDEFGNREIPSFVSALQEQVAGEIAWQQRTLCAHSTLFGMKRWIGRPVRESVLDSSRKHPYPRVATLARPAGAVRAEEATAQLVRHLKEAACVYLGHQVTFSVITVPTGFSIAQRRATLNACKLAGLKSTRLLSGPTAAAVVFASDRLDMADSNVVFFDFGAGSLDVSVVNLDQGVIETKATSSDLELGGEDFTQRLVDHCLLQLHGTVRRDDTSSCSEHILSRLRTHCERAKLTLSSHEHATINIDCLSNGHDFTTSVSRLHFEELCQDLWPCILAPLQDALHTAQLPPSSVVAIVLLGGASRMPKVQTLLRGAFPAPLDLTLLDSHAVARGAAMQAALCTGSLPEELSSALCVLDAAPTEIGLEVAGGRFDTLISKHALVPCSAQRTFTTFHDSARPGLRVRLFEAKRHVTCTASAELLGVFCVSGVTPAPRGVPRIVMRFSLDDSAVLTVTAHEHPPNAPPATLLVTREGDDGEDEPLRRETAHDRGGMVMGSVHDVVWHLAEEEERASKESTWCE